MHRTGELETCCGREGDLADGTSGLHRVSQMATGEGDILGLSERVEGAADTQG